MEKENLISSWTRITPPSGEVRPHEPSLFISHASEDKEKLVLPLVAEFTHFGGRVWAEEYELQPGDSLRQEIDRGRLECDFGIVVLGKHFFARRWPQWELDGLLYLEIERDRKVVCPIWHGIGRQEVSSVSSPLAGRLAIDSKIGIQEIAQRIIHAASASSEGTTVSEVTRPPAEPNRRQPSERHWDSEVFDIAAQDRKGARRLRICGFLDRFRLPGSLSEVFGHIMCAYPADWRAPSEHPPTQRLVNGADPDAPPFITCQKSGEVGDLLVELEPAHAFRVTSGGEELDAILFSTVGVSRLGGFRIRPDPHRPAFSALRRGDGIRVKEISERSVGVTEPMRSFNRNRRRRAAGRIRSILHWPVGFGASAERVSRFGSVPPSTSASEFARLSETGCFRFPPLQGEAACALLVST